MPIVDVEIVGARSLGGLAQEIADDVGDAFGASAGKVWVRLRALEAGNYAENRTQAPMPVFVSVLASAPPEGEALEALVGRITQAVARRTGRAADLVHVVFEPAARGRIAFGGRLVK